MTTVEAPAGTAGASDPHRHLRTVPALGDGIRAGAVTGIGSLPHRSVHDAAAFALREYDLPTIPTLPRRSPAEGMIAQAVLGIRGVTLGQYGSIAVDVDALDPDAPVVTDLANDAFAGVRTFLATAAARGLQGPVKWQFVGPVTLGAALTRVGVPVDRAFAVAGRAVRAHVAALTAAVAAALPASPQVVWLDEPWFGDLMHPGFPIAPDPAIDLLSSAMAALEPTATVGVHCCADVDIASLLAAGPAVLSVPVDPQLAGVAGYLMRFLERGGRIAWGVVPTDGPIATSSERSWRQLSDVWCELVKRGCDSVVLRQRSLVTPHCGLGLHTPAVADRVARLTREVGRRVNEQAVASRFALGSVGRAGAAIWAGFPPRWPFGTTMPVFCVSEKTGIRRIRSHSTSRPGHSSVSCGAYPQQTLGTGRTADAGVDRVGSVGHHSRSSTTESGERSGRDRLLPRER